MTSRLKDLFSEFKEYEKPKSAVDLEKIERLEKEREEKILEDHKKCVKKLKLEQKTELEKAFKTFVSDPDFLFVYNQLRTIPTIKDKWGFILRKAYEMEGCTGHLFQHNFIFIKRKLENYCKLWLLCIFYKETEGTITNEQCLINGSPVDTICQGNHEICVVFEDRARQCAMGLLQLPNIKRPKPLVRIPEIDVPPVDLEDLNDWWLGEGKYT